MFEFPPLSDIEPGVYDFQVLKAEQKRSKSGNQMIELTLAVWDANGVQRHIFDYLVSMPSMVYKIKHFCDTVGLTKEYLAGCLNVNDCVDKCGKAEIIIQKGNQKPDGSYYPDKNAVKDYVVTDKDAVKADLVKPNNNGSEFKDDDLPF